MPIWVMLQPRPCEQQLHCSTLLPTTAFQLTLLCILRTLLGAVLHPSVVFVLTAMNSAWGRTDQSAPVAWLWKENWTGYLASWATASVTGLMESWEWMLLDVQKHTNLAAYITLREIPGLGPSCGSEEHLLSAQWLDLNQLFVNHPHHSDLEQEQDFMACSYCKISQRQRPSSTLGPITNTVQLLNCAK